jgi:hypothetical protein
MIHQHDFAYKGWLATAGKPANWVETPFPQKRIVPKFLVRELDYEARSSHEVRAGFRDIARSTDQRTMISAALPSFPCGNKVPFLRSTDAFALVAVLNSYSYDWTQRTRQGSTTVNYFILSEAPLMRVAYARELRTPALRLGACNTRFAVQWLASAISRGIPWRRWWAVTRHERLRVRCILDVIVAARLGLSRDDVRWILRDCDYPAGLLSDMAFRRTLQATGFWRVDKDEDPELRHTVLTLVAFDALWELIEAHGGDRDAGIAAFSALNGGEGWMLPEMLRLKDHGLGHDERAEHPQPVASRLGPRFLDWQLAQTPEESWAECERHARNILGDAEFEARFGKGKPASAQLASQSPESARRTDSTRSRQGTLFD